MLWIFVVSIASSSVIGGMIVDDPRLLSVVLPKIRADLQVADTYTPAAAPALPCPIRTFAGDAALWHHWRDNLRRLARPAAARTIAAQVLSECTAPPLFALSPIG